MAELVDAPDSKSGGVKPVRVRLPLPVPSLCPATRGRPPHGPATYTQGMTSSRPGGPASPAHWEHFCHQADIGVRGFGATRDEAFEQAALALTGVITQPAKVRLSERVVVECSAPDIEILLADWLNALVFEMASRQMLFGDFSVSIAGQTLRAEVLGEPVDRARHRPAVEVKGATYTELRVGRLPGGQGWFAQAILDV